MVYIKSVLTHVHNSKIPLKRINGLYYLVTLENEEGGQLLILKIFKSSLAFTKWNAVLKLVTLRHEYILKPYIPNVL